jgi:hypothetical protein
MLDLLHTRFIDRAPAQVHATLLDEGTYLCSPVSCKGRGFCPRCGGRRMAERSAHLIDHVFADVPVRQWVLSLPHRLRYLLAC